MVRILADSSTLYSPAQAQAAGFDVTPLSVTIGSESWRELAEISSEDFLAKVAAGGLPTSSQPAVGDVAALYEKYAGEPVLHITMADGLSGTYQAARAAAEMVESDPPVQVLNSRTLCGPHRFLVENAVRLARQGLSRPAIVRRTEELMQTEKSFLIPSDFAYLRRGGRLSPLVSYVGQAVRLAPLLTLTADATRLTVSAVKRSYLHAVEAVIHSFAAHGVGENWCITITHAGAAQAAEKARWLLQKAFPAARLEVLPLSPVFIAQGGPGCVAIQTIRMV